MGVRDIYAREAYAFGRLLADRGIGLVFGGGSVGLMGKVADGALDAGGEVIGVMPHGLKVRELEHKRVHTMHVVDSMHERKALMESLSDAFVALPGGFGTQDELFEILTWSQLGIHQKPVGLLNTQKYYDPWIALIDHQMREGFVKPIYKELFVVDESGVQLLERLQKHSLPEVTQWNIKA